MPLIYVAPNFCEAEFSSTSEPIIVLSPIRRRSGPTGLVVTNDGDSLTLSWGTVDGAICYNVYAVVGENYILVAECITDPSIVLDPGTYVVTVITAEGESDPSDPITFEGPGEVCVLRIVDYGSVTQPFFIPPAGSPSSTAVEWDGIWNLLNALSAPSSYWYSDVNGKFTSDLGDAGVGPDIAVGGKAVSEILLDGPKPANINILEDYWRLVIFFRNDDIFGPPFRTWEGFKVGGDTTTPVGVYVSAEILVPVDWPPGTNSDSRPSVIVEFCEF